MQRRWPRELGYDVLCVVVFVVIGRRSHHEGNAVTETLRVAAPFVLGLLAAYAIGARRRDRAGEVAFGALVWLTTLVIGMVLRRTLFDRGTATGFVVVATVFLGATLVGRRALRQWVLRRRGAEA